MDKKKFKEIFIFAVHAIRRVHKSYQEKDDPTC